MDSTSMFEPTSTTSVILIFLLVFMGYLAIKAYLKNWLKRFPPGPRGLSGLREIIGANINDNLHELAYSWAEKFGPITFYTVFGQSICILNSTDVTTELLASDDYKLKTAGRTQNVVSEMAWYHGKDMVFTPYDTVLKKKRSLFHKGVYGDGVDSFERAVGVELGRLIEEVELYQDKDTPLDKILAKSLKRVLFILVHGECPAAVADVAVDTLERYDKAVNTMLEIQNLTALTFFPFVRKFGKYKKMCQELEQSKEEAEKILFMDVKSSFVPGQIRGLCDVLLDTQGKPDYEWMDDDHIKGILTNTFFAAHMNSRAVLLNAFLILAHHPEIAERIRKEINDVIGSRSAKVKDRADMPYTEAFILEVLRYVSQTPLSNIRCVGEDISYDGYTIPKGTQVFANQWFYHRDPRLWKEPWTFKPDRFLDSNGQLLTVDHPIRKRLQAFGTGLRMCPGERFARCRVFLYVVNLVGRFHIEPPEQGPLAPYDPNNNLKGLIRQPPPYSVSLLKVKVGSVNPLS